MNASCKQTTYQQEEKTQVRSLLHFVELLSQALEIKMETLYSFPVFLHSALQQVQTRASTQMLADVGKDVVNHVRTLQQMIKTLGGHTDHIGLDESYRPNNDPLTDEYFQEELTKQILEESLQLMNTGWLPDSEMRRWLEERLEVIIHESEQHLSMFDRMFCDTQPRYRDVVLQRFRVTAIP